ncbi:hypothetical protein OXYTRIMIC_304 [Oxytricha trifallax]|uniref:Uncharacterized protein n=1 Tax=Oxytricha trifallax TaxID=1172189 RepID=A0A073HZT3_9SPIT|nr:hypothetical protein OXYTRIMIC_304 [Oxytricha trifallax]
MKACLYHSDSERCILCELKGNTEALILFAARPKSSFLKPITSMLQKRMAEASCDDGYYTLVDDEYVCNFEINFIQVIFNDCVVAFSFLHIGKTVHTPLVSFMFYSNRLYMKRSTKDCQVWRHYPNHHIRPVQRQHI